MTTPHVFVVVLRNDARKLECTVCTRPPFSLRSNGSCNNKHDVKCFILGLILGVPSNVSGSMVQNVLVYLAKTPALICSQLNKTDTHILEYDSTYGALRSEQLQ